MTKICHMTSAHPWSDTRIFHKELKSLRDAGYEPHLVVNNAASRMEDGIAVHGVTTTNRGRLSRMVLGTMRVYRESRRLKADVYHFHDPELMPWALLLRLRGATVVYDVHEDLPRDILMKEWIPAGLRRAMSWFFERFENAVARCMSGVIAATPHIRERFVRAGIDARNVGNFPRIEELTPRRQDQVQKLHVCYVGAISRARGIREIVRALEHVPQDVKLVLCGTFTDAALEVEVRSLPGWSKVDYLGQVDRHTVQQVVAESLAGLSILQPSEAFLDALPTKIFEYMACGVPVLVSDFPLWRTIVEQSDCGFAVDPTNPEAIARAIHRLSADFEHAKALGINGRHAVENAFNWDIESRELIKLYGELSPLSDATARS